MNDNFPASLLGGVNDVQQPWSYQSEAGPDCFVLTLLFIGRAYFNPLRIVKNGNVDCPRDLTLHEFTFRAYVDDR